MDESRVAAKDQNTDDKDIATMPWTVIQSASSFTDLDLVDFRTMLEELEYK